MTRTTSLPSVLAATLALCLCGAPAQAQIARTFVSAASGNDASDCNRATPCRTFQVAHDKTLANGEITVLDPGGYGAVTINKTVSIINDGVGEAGVLVSGGLTGITVAAGAGDAVSLRGVTVKGIGFGGGTGIRFTGGKSLTIENCIVRNLSFDGIDFVANGSSSLAVSNTLVADNGAFGILVQPTGSGVTVKASFNRVETYNNGASGILVSGNAGTGTIAAAVAESVSANNASSGFLAGSAAGQAATILTVVNSVSANNGTNGILSSGTGAIVRVGRSTIAGNATGVAVASGGLLWSYGDSNIDGNGTDGAPATTTLK